FEEVTHQITLIASSTKTVAQCPLCQKLSHRIHSRYERKLTDIPWANYSVTLVVTRRLVASATFVVCIPTVFKVVTGLQGVFYARVEGVNPLGESALRAKRPVQVALS
ncbi:MAG: transposase family protein, partial [Rhizonema sp. NSF051]|nr:transposase family protein [Rhizonema sp. NSF051]